MLNPPKDTVSHRDSPGVQINCTVEGMTHRDSLTWWRHSQDGYQKLYESNPKVQSSRAADPVSMDSQKYEIIGHYNLYIKDIDEEDAGLYICEVMGQANYTAELLVVGEN